MDRSGYGLIDINYWYSVTSDYHFAVADIVVINTTLEQIETPYIFKRNPAFCYLEPLRDYGMKYCPAVEYLALINTLRTEFSHFKVNPKDLGRTYDNSKNNGPSFGHYGPCNFGKIAKSF
jgi:hypothetical protein